MVISAVVGLGLEVSAIKQIGGQSSALFSKYGNGGNKMRKKPFRRPRIVCNSNNVLIDQVVEQSNNAFNDIFEQIGTLTAQIEALEAGGSNLVFIAETGSEAAGTLIPADMSIPFESTVLNTLAATISTNQQVITIPATALYTINYTILTETTPAPASDAIFLNVNADGDNRRYWATYAQSGGFFGNKVLGLEAGDTLQVTAFSPITLSEIAAPVAVITITQIGQYTA